MSRVRREAHQPRNPRRNASQQVLESTSVCVFEAGDSSEPMQPGGQSDIRVAKREVPQRALL